MAKKYKLLIDSESLECQDYSTNTDKVYHVGVLQLHDGTYDVMSFYGRRGKGLAQKTYNNHKALGLAVTEMNKIVQQKIKKGYQIATQVFSKVDIWGLWVESVVVTGKDQDNPKPAPPKTAPPKKTPAPAALKIVEDDSTAPDTWFW